ncbi:MAG TPA: thiamine phosphate synthase [Candidatus Xenobia bacterium]|nr:thiamine phosphate synthase [Candidatus Xenobia bacterium]
MSRALPRFYAILDPALRPEVPATELARLLVRAGVRLVQLRAKTLNSGELLGLARGLLATLPPSCRLIINDRADVAVLAGAAGVHVGQDDLPARAARQVVGPEGIVGFSTHSIAQLEAAGAAPVDYLAFGPVFATSTKPDHEPVVGLEGLREAHRRTARPLVAIGGITAENAAQVIEAGANSVAVIGGWMTAEDIPGRLEAFRRALGRLD